MERLNFLPDTINKNQLLFGINQGCTFDDLRIENMKEIADLDLDGYAIGGLAVGEPKEDMYRIISAVEPYMPAQKPRYLMGVGTPGNIIEGVSRGYAKRAAEAYKSTMPIGMQDSKRVQLHFIDGGGHMFSKKHDVIAMKLLKEFAAKHE